MVDFNPFDKDKDSDNVNVTRNAPWGPQARGWKYGYGQARNLYQQNQGYQPGFGSTSQAALTGIANLARRGNPMLNNAIGAVGGISSGQTNIGTGGMFGAVNNQASGAGSLAQGGSAYNQVANGIGPSVNAGMFGDIAQANTGPGSLSTPGSGYAQLANGRGGIGTGMGFQQIANRAEGQSPLDRGAYENVARGFGGVDSSGFGRIGASANQTDRLAQGMFGDTAKGRMVDSNPYHDAVLQSTMDDVQNRVKASMSAGGRYGGGLMGKTMSEGLANTSNQYRANAYENDMNRMMQASQAASGAELNRLGLQNQAMQGKTGVNLANQANMMRGTEGRAQDDLSRMGVGLNALQGRTGVQAQNIANMMGAAQGQAGQQAQMMNTRLSATQGRAGAQGQNIANMMAAAQGRSAEEMQRMGVQLSSAQGLSDVQNSNIDNRMAAAALTPQMNAARYSDMDRLMGIGAARDQMAQQQQQFPWQNLGQYMGVMGNGSGGTTTAPGTNPYVSAIGGGITGAQLGGYFGPAGSIIGAGLGAFAGYGG